MSNLNSALYFAQRYGWKLFPAYWGPNRKGKISHNPLVAWSEQSSSDPQIIQSWSATYPDCYFCVAAQQSNVTILDVDNKHGKKGSSNLFSLELNNEDLPLTLKSKTPSDGFHYFFTGTSGISTDKIGSGIDTPVMCPVPGSHVTSKGNYDLLDQIDPAPLPTWIHTLAGEKKERTQDFQIPAIELDQPENIMEATLYLQTALPALQGEGGDAHTYKVACRVRDFGISEDTCSSLMLQMWYPRCQPSNNPEFVTTKIHNAYNYALTKAGENSAENMFSPIMEDADGFFHISKLQGNPPDREWIVENWLPKGEVSSLYGDGGLGKSIISLQLAMAVPFGVPWLECPVVNMMPSLYIACEDSEDEVHRRWNAIRSLPEYMFADQVLMSTKAYVETRVGKDSILAWIDRNNVRKGKYFELIKQRLNTLPKGPKLLILDTIADIFAGNENSRFEVNYFVKTIVGELKRDFDLTVLLVGHTSKAGDYSGSTAWNNATRSRWIINPYDKNNTAMNAYRILERSKSNYAATGDQLIMKYDKDTYLRIDGEDVYDTTKDANADIIVDLIATQSRKGQPLGDHHNSKPNIYEIDIKDAEGKKMTMPTIKAVLNQLVMEDVVKRVTGSKHLNGYHLT